MIELLEISELGDIVTLIVILKSNIGLSIYTISHGIEEYIRVRSVKVDSSRIYVTCLKTEVFNVHDYIQYVLKVNKVK